MKNVLKISQNPSNGLQIAQAESLDHMFGRIGDRQRELSGKLEKAGYDQTQFKEDDARFKAIRKQWAPILKFIKPDFLLAPFKNQSLIPNWNDKDKFGNPILPLKQIPGGNYPDNPGNPGSGGWMPRIPIKTAGAGGQKLQRVQTVDNTA